ncbi:hypothetical protein BASA83_013421 [Batrachochytrium salamandrivorans]|nr:hypothetical protein BASA83_013421 [Batrachochytrium salamandrivorans]
MASLEDLSPSPTVSDQRYDTDRKKIATLGTLLTIGSVMVQPYIEQPERTPTTYHHAVRIYAAEFRQLTADIDWNDAALRSQFYSGLSSKSRTTLYIANHRAAVQSSPFRRNQPPTQPIPRIHSQQYQQQMLTLTPSSTIQQPSTSITATPVQQRPTSNDMDIDFARRGPLTTAERQQRFSQDSALFASGYRNGTLSTQDPGKRSRPTLSRDLDSAVKPIPPEALRTDMMNMEDGDGLENCTEITAPVVWGSEARKCPIDCSLSDSISLESMQADVYPFVEVSPVSDVSVPPDILSSFSSLFSEDQAETLPPHRDFDCSIELKPGSEPFHGKIYQLTREEDKVMQNGSKTTSEKFYSSEQQFSSWRTMLLCQAKRQTSTLYGLPSAIPAHDELLVSRRHRKTCSGLSDDIVIYSDNMSDHIVQVQNVLRVLQDNELYCKAESATSTSRRSSYLGYTHFLLMDFGWIRLKSRLFRVGRHQESSGLCKFLLGFTNFYRALIHDYSSMTANLTKLFKKDATLVGAVYFGDRCIGYAISGVLSQYDDSNTLSTDRLLCAPNEIALSKITKIYDKSCLLSSSHLNIGGIPPRWSPSCYRLVRSQELGVLHDDQELTRRQARWSLELSEYDFSLTHRPGKLNGRADSLSRREDYKSVSWTGHLLVFMQPLPIRPVPPVALPFERWGIVSMANGRDQAREQVFNYLLDYATRWVLAKPVKEMTESCRFCFPLRAYDDLWCSI